VFLYLFQKSICLRISNLLEEDISYWAIVSSSKHVVEKYINILGFSGSMEKITFLGEDKLNQFSNILKKKLTGFFPSGSKVAVKLHMGEEGNNYYLKPDFVKKVIDALKELNLKPFLFDSPVMYGGERDSVEKYYKTAEKHGFKDICPIVISNESVGVKTKHLDAEVCKQIYESENMLVLSHVKGHSCAGFGATIKNLGMGGVSKKTKKDIHAGGGPIIQDNCNACGICAEACSNGAITIQDKAVCNHDSCWGCSICYYLCPNKAIKVKNATFDVLLAESAGAVIKNMKKVFYVNVLMNIAKHCDCWSNENEIVLDDIGVLLGKDMVAIDKASLDLINKKAGKDLFEEIHKKSPRYHIEAASKLGIGSLAYRLEK